MNDHQKYNIGHLQFCSLSRSMLYALRSMLLMKIMIERTDTHNNLYTILDHLTFDKLDFFSSASDIKKKTQFESRESMIFF